MATKGRMHADLAIPFEYVGELVAASLRAQGWQQLNYNDMVREISAELKKSDRRAGMTFQRDYKLSASWTSQNEKVRVQIEVQETTGNARLQDCQQAAYEVIAGIAERLEKLQETLANAKPRTTYGKAKWASLQELTEKGWTAEGDFSGLVLGPSGDGKKIVLPQDETARHAMVCGPTGCGKSSSIFKPNLFERTGISAIVTEATAGDEPPDLFHTTSGFRADSGRKPAAESITSIRMICAACA